MENLIQNIHWYHVVITILSIILVIILIKYYTYKAEVCDTYHKAYHVTYMKDSWTEKTSYGTINHYVKKCEKCGRKWVKEKRSSRIKGYLS